jgi:hypothetical protein
MNEENSPDKYARLHAEDVLNTFENETFGSSTYIAAELGGALRQLLATSKESTGYANGDKDLRIAQLEDDLRQLKGEASKGSEVLVPDDSDHDEAILEAESFVEALWAIAEKYDVPVTNNYPRWQDGQYLRLISDFIEDVTTAVKKHS